VLVFVRDANLSYAAKEPFDALPRQQPPLTTDPMVEHALALQALRSILRKGVITFARNLFPRIFEPAKV
jgi:hypothetical protein